MLKKGKTNQKFSKFPKIFKKLRINIPFVDAFQQIPKYMKFMKGILANNKKLTKYEIVALIEECRASLQTKIPLKLKDPESFNILCTVGKLEIKRALCELGVIINLMFLFFFKRLELGEAKPTTVTLHLAYRTFKYPRGVIEDVLVKEGKFMFPANFLILDMEEDEDIPIIHGIHS